MFNLHKFRRTAHDVSAALRVHNVRDEIGFQLEAAAYLHACEGGPAPLPRWRYVAPAALSVSRVLACAAICAVKGHAIEDAGSYAGPEGAADSFSCRRCGEHFHHTYF